MRKLIIASVLTVAICFTCNAQVIFDSNFESGSLGGTVLIDSMNFCVSPGDTVQHLSYLIKGSFDPVNPIDTTLAASAAWYYFSMSGVKGKQVYLTFEDCGTHRSMYSYDNVTWQHFDMNEAPRQKVDKRFKHDTVYFALYVPYTYSYLQKRFASWTSREGTTLDTIGYSFEHRPLQMLHVTDPSIPQNKKAVIWIQGRQHTSETPGSWMLDGLIESLTSDTDQGRALRQQIDAYILPFTNPDGVVNGLSRSNMTGVNQEINFGRSDDSTVVEVKAIKAMFEKLTADRPVDVMINSHSQHADHATFWMHTGRSTTYDFLRRQWVLTGLTCCFNDYITPTDMLFSSPAPRYPEGWFWSHTGDRTLAITIETPYTCYSRNRDGECTSNDNLRVLGERLLQATAEYLEISTPDRIIVETPDNISSDWTPIDLNQETYMGRDGWKAIRKGAKVIYSLQNLGKGEYEIYRYIPGKNIEPPEGKDNIVSEETGPLGWVKEATYTQRRDGRFKYVYRAKQEGDPADALLLIRK